MTAMISPEKEKVNFLTVTFIKPIICKAIDVNEGDKKGNVEKWLLEIEDAMHETLKDIMKQAIKDTKTPRVDWVINWPAQIVLAGNMIRWTNETEKAYQLESNM